MKPTNDLQTVASIDCQCYWVWQNCHVVRDAVLVQTPCQEDQMRNRKHLHVEQNCAFHMTMPLITTTMLKSMRQLERRWCLDHSESMEVETKDGELLALKHNPLLFVCAGVAHRMLSFSVLEPTHAIWIHSLTLSTVLSSFLAVTPCQFSFFYKFCPLLVNFFPLKLVLGPGFPLMLGVGLSRRLVKMESEGRLKGRGVGGAGEGVVMMGAGVVPRPKMANTEGTLRVLGVGAGEATATTGAAVMGEAVTGAAVTGTGVTGMLVTGAAVTGMLEIGASVGG